jgi:Ca-activated chloride channel homolog
MRMLCGVIASYVGALLLLSGCGDGGPAGSSGHGSEARGRQSGIAADLTIVSGSENTELEPIIHRFARKRGVTIDVHYQGSVDIMLLLQQGSAMDADAVWPAHSLWIELGDIHRVVKQERSILHSPVVFGVKRSVAQRLGWIGNDITIADVLEAAQAGKLRFAMTSATQSNSGAAAYFGFLYAMAGSPQILKREHLEDETVQKSVTALLKLVNKTAGSSGWLKEMVVAKYDQFDAMVNYEAMIIEANRELLKLGKEPMIAIYPQDGIMMADSPLGYVEKGDATTAALFNELQEYLLSEPVQKEILHLGRRTGIVGLDAASVDPAVFNPEWGIDVTRVISAVPTPAEDVLRMALDLYQGGGLRKPSATVYVLDFSGSMQGEGEEQLKHAMRILLDPQESKRYLLQPSSRDLHFVVPFDASPRTLLALQGNDSALLGDLLGKINALRADGGTDIYRGVEAAYDALAKVENIEEYFPSIILMTDGQSKGDVDCVKRAMQSVPQAAVFSITFGQADDSQLKVVSDLTGGRVFHGHKDLASAFRKAKGYN